MDLSLLTEVVTTLLGGLGLFLLGLKYMSEGMQTVAGNRLRKMISAVTDNRLMACGTGTLITGLIQSSSVCSVMAIGLVNAGVMDLVQAIGVIIGSNVGTTFTGWILAIKIGKYGLPILGIAVFFFLFSKSDRTRYIAMAIMGIGMVFFGMETMSSGFKAPEVREILRSVFSTLSGGSYMEIIKCALVGCVATMIVQSSSATLGLTIALAQSGVIEYNTAAGLILGLNIGTTITAVLAGINSSTDGKRAALVHVIFNIIGTLWILPIFPWYTRMIDQLFANTSSIGAQIAFTHTAFNLVNTVIFLPLLPLLAKLVKYFIPEKKKEIHKLTYLDIRTVNSPSLGILQSKDQILFMANSIKQMMDRLAVIGSKPEGDPDIEHKVFRREEILDNVQKEIFVFLSKLVAGQVSREVSTQAHRQIRLADEYESLSDYISHVLKGHIKLRENKELISEDGRKALMDLHSNIAEYIEEIHTALEENDAGILEYAAAEGGRITNLMKKYRAEHLERLAKSEVSPFKSLVFTDMLNHYRRMKDHAKNIAQVVAGEK